MSRLFLHSIWSDLRLALRRLRREPIFAALVIGLPGLGIGASIVIFSLAGCHLQRARLPDPQPVVR